VKLIIAKRLFIGDVVLAFALTGFMLLSALYAPSPAYWAVVGLHWIGVGLTWPRYRIKFSFRWHGWRP
jgi:hypothetical protein